MTKEIILDTVNQCGKTGRWLIKFLKDSKPEVWNEIMEQTKFLTIAYGKEQIYVPFKARIFCIENNITELPKCANPECKHEHSVRWDYSIDNFKTYCCTECCHSHWYKSDRFKQKSMYTCEQKYGFKFYVQTDDFKEKSSKTCLKNYGVEHITMSDEWRDKVKQTCQRKYKADSPLESKLVQQKIMKKCFETYGVSNPLLSPEFQEKARNTIMLNHGGVGYAADDIKDKAYRTSESRYGTAHFTQTIEYH